MAIIDQDRGPLDAALADPDSVLLLLVGDTASHAQALHDESLRMHDMPWRRVFLLRDVAVLTTAERARWVNSNERYAYHRVEGNVDGKRGATSELLRTDGKPSILRIRSGFAHVEAQ